jgi:quercetin dioxygenase-like cupin family protein
MSEEYTFIEDLVGQLPELPPESIVSRTLLSDRQMKVVLFGFAPGQELSEHTASKTAILHILQGSAQVTLGEDVHEAREGTWVHMPAHMPHSVLAKTSVNMLLLMIES